jgi:16S rRNA (cytosine967-C5)-methyltransferase
MKDAKIIAQSLLSVYDGQYSSQALLLLVKEAAEPALATKVFLGVLEFDVRLEYFLSKLCAKRPKRLVRTLIKIGIYALENLNIKNYAVVNSVVSAAKREERGLVNAVLRRFADGVPLPECADERLAVEWSKPRWLVQKLITDFGQETAEKMLKVSNFELEHARPITSKMNISALKQLLPEGVESDAGGLFVKNTAEVRKLFDEGKLTLQSVCSVKVAEAVVDACDGIKKPRVLDMCAAPGGKACYVAEKLPEADVVACDIHPHRVELIKSYAKRAGVKNITPLLKDGTKTDAEWLNSFDVVLVDAPCSGLGVVHKKPDILLRLQEADIADLVCVQTAIVKTGLEYLKPGGVLVYSTCTVTAEENEGITKRLGKKIMYEQRFTKDVNGHDGFYLAVVKK